MLNYQEALNSKINIMNSGIGIIIPVYNGENYIKQCYHSLRQQTYQDWEAIFVNDGSKDRTMSILQKIAEEDSRVKVISQRNSGTAVARETGIKNATKDYITFLDVDDTLSEDALLIFTDDALKNNADIVVVGISIIDNSKVIKEIGYECKILSGKGFLYALCTSRIRWQLCGKAYRKTLFEGIITPKNLIAGEDMAVCMQVGIKADTVYIDNRIVYNYVQNSSSVTHSKNISLSIDTILSAKLVEDEMSKRNDFCELQNYVDSLFLLCLSSALFNGIDSNQVLVRDILKKHTTVGALCHIPILKAIPIIFLKLLSINILSFRR